MSELHLSARARRLRFILFVAAFGLALFAVPTWSTVAVLFVLGAVWISATFFGLILDEYFPKRKHSPR